MNASRRQMAVANVAQQSSRSSSGSTSGTVSAGFASRAVHVVLSDGRAWLFAIPCLIALIVYQWAPLATTVVDSFFAFRGLGPTHFDGLANYRAAFENPDLGATFANTLMYVGWSLVIGFPLPVIIAIAISELPRWRGLFRICVYVPALVPSIIAGFMWQDIYSNSPGGLLNQLLHYVGIGPSGLLQTPYLNIVLIVLTLTWGGFGATTILYLAGLSGINRELYEAAAIDGAGFFRRTWNVALPSIRGLMELFLILQIVGVFQVFVQPLVMTNGGPGNSTYTLVLLAYRTAFEFFEPGEADVVGVLTFLSLVILTAFYLYSNRATDRPAVRYRRWLTKKVHIHG